MKRLAIFSRKDFIISAVILITGALTLGLPSICSSASSYVNIPILNNHYPQTATITNMYVCAPVPCYTGGSGSGRGGGRGGARGRGGVTWYNVKKVKKIRFGDTVVFSTGGGECCCIGKIKHLAYPGQTYTFNRNGNKYDFSGPKVTCRVTLDVDPAPSGDYTIKYTYRLPGDTADRENQLTFNLP